MKRDTRSLLTDAAIVALSKNPGASMAEIADVAAVGRATLYRHFPSRDDLMRELLLESYAQMAAALAPLEKQDLSAKDLLLAVLEAIVPLGDRFHFLLQENSFEDDPEIQALHRQDQRDWEALFERLKAERVIAQDISTHWAIALIEALIYTTWLSVKEGYIATREAPKLVYRTLLSGLGPITDE